MFWCLFNFPIIIPYAKFILHCHINCQIYRSVFVKILCASPENIFQFVVIDLDINTNSSKKILESLLYTLPCRYVNPTLGHSCKIFFSGYAWIITIFRKSSDNLISYLFGYVSKYFIQEIVHSFITNKFSKSVMGNSFMKNCLSYIVCTCGVRKVYINLSGIYIIPAFHFSSFLNCFLCRSFRYFIYGVDNLNGYVKAFGYLICVNNHAVGTHWIIKEYLVFSRYIFCLRSKCTSSFFRRHIKAWLNISCFYFSGKFVISILAFSQTKLFNKILIFLVSIFISFFIITTNPKIKSFVESISAWHYPIAKRHSQRSVFIANCFVNIHFRSIAS